LSYADPQILEVGTVVSINPTLNPTAYSYPLTYSVVPALPTGLTLNTSTGEISGTPTLETAASNYTVTAYNSGGTQSFTINITVNYPALAGLSYIDPQILDVGTVVSITPTLDPAGYSYPLTYSVIPALPAGLSLDTGTGEISGTPTLETAAGNYTVTADNSGGTQSFTINITVNPVLATLTTTLPVYASLTQADSGGDISNTGGGTITEHGVCWNTTGTPTTADSCTALGAGVAGPFSSTMNGLTVGFTYYVRAYAVNGAGTAYGNEVSYAHGSLIQPNLTSVTIRSDNANTLLAGIGNTVTLSFTSHIPIMAPSVSIAGHDEGTGVNVTGASTTWQATYTMQDGDADGTVPFVISNIRSLLLVSSPDVNATTDSLYVDFDGTVPTVSIGTPSATVINGSGSVDFGITYSGADTVNLTQADVTLTTTVSANCGTITVTGGATAAPTVTLSACTGNGTVAINIGAGTSSDTAGNTNVLTGPGTPFTVDTTAPAGYTASIDQAYINTTNQTALSVSFSGAEIGSTYNLVISDGADTFTSSSTITIDPGTFVNIDVSGLADGTLTLSFTLTDPVGNTGITVTDTAIKDTVIPAVAFTSTPDINAANQTSYTVSGTCSDDGRMVIVSINGVDTLGPSCLGGTFSATGMDVSAEPEGTVLVEARHTDEAANAATPASSSVAKDTIAPTVTIGTPSPTVVNGSGSVDFGITCTGADTVNLTILDLSLSTTGDANCGNFNVANGTSMAPIVTLSSCTGNGTVRLSIDPGTSSDLAGNTDPGAGPSAFFTVDTIAPGLSWNSVPAIYSSNQSGYTVTGYCDENGLPVTVTISDGINPDVVDSPTCTSSQFTTASLDVSGLSDVTVNVSADHADAAGNNTHIDTSVTKDVIAPSVYFTSTPDINISNQLTYSVSGYCSEEGLQVRVNIGGDAAFVTCTGNAFTRTMDASGFPETSISMTTEQWDAVNNYTSDSASVMKDTVAPTVAITSSASPGPTSASPIPVTITFSEDVTVFMDTDISVTNGSVTNFAGGPSIYTADIVPTGFGTVTVDVNAGVGFDSAGNPNDAAPQFSIDYLNDDASLSNLTVTPNDGWSPSFNSGIYTYNVYESSSYGSATVTATLSDTNATVTINSIPGASQSFILNPGTIVVTILVTAQDGTTTQSYTVNMVVPWPADINVLQSTPAGSTFYFNDIYVGNSDGPRTFTIQNLGDESLNVSNCSLSGTNQSDFSLSGWTSGTINGGGSQNLLVTFTPNPSGPETRTATLTITSDDPNEPSYIIYLQGVCYEPDINVKRGIVDYPSGSSTYDFGTVQNGATKTVIFTVENTGSGILTISDLFCSDTATFATDYPGISTEFYNLESGTSVTFTVTFRPTIPGTNSYAATISLTSNDYDAGEQIYDISLSGTGVDDAIPDIDVRVGAVEYLSGDTYTFDTVMNTDISRTTFVILNRGVGGLEISGITLADGTRYAISSGPGTTSIPGGGATAFTVEYCPMSSDPETDTITITSNDPDLGYEDNYTINLTGHGNGSSLPTIDVTINGVEFPSGSLYDFGFAGYGEYNEPVTFTITNNGYAALDLTAGYPSVDTEDETVFQISGLTGTSIWPSGTATFEVTFTPDAVGPFSTVLTIESNTETYTLNLNGGGLPWSTPDIKVTDIGETETYLSGTYFVFDEVLIDDTLTANFLVKNVSMAAIADLNINNVTITGVHASDFSIITTPATPPATPVASGGIGGNAMDISFTPSGEGMRTANLIIETNDPDEHYYVIRLAGFGVMPIRVVHAGGSSYTSVYDPITNTFTMDGVSLSTLARAGAQSFKFESPSGYTGQYLVLHGSYDTGQHTTIYDPAGHTFMGGEQTGIAVLAGANSFKLTTAPYENQILIVCGGGSTNSLRFNPTLTSGYFTTNPVTFGTAVGDGSFNFTDLDGNTVIVYGNNSPYYRVYNQSTNTLGPTYDMYYTRYASIGAGGHAFRITSGLYAGYMLIIEGGGSTAAWLFYPSTIPTITLHAETLSSIADTGSFSIPIRSGPNAGMALIVHGGSSPTTSLYYTDGHLGNGPALSGPVGDGAFAFQITGGEYKGMFMIVYNYTQTTIFNPDTLAFIDLGTDEIPGTYYIGAGAHCFPDR
ncbi:MAG: choice-of-anchor D domain-containing protein, partial [Spirochaetes bacterium]|nr:choice-of-anchor D domain-containing protein [Spirochaetota bacterium]